jgi:hypothetical protein
VAVGRVRDEARDLSALHSDERLKVPQAPAPIVQVRGLWRPRSALRFIIGRGCQHVNRRREHYRHSFEVRVGVGAHVHLVTAQRPRSPAADNLEL